MIRLMCLGLYSELGLIESADVAEAVAAAASLVSKLELGVFCTIFTHGFPSLTVPSSLPLALFDAAGAEGLGVVFSVMTVDGGGEAGEASLAALLTMGVWA